MPDSSSTMRMFGISARCRSAHRFCCNRQLNHKTAADRLVFFYANRSMVILNYPAHNSESQPGSTLLRRKIGQEEALLYFLRNSMARVGDDELNGFTARHQ